MQLKWLEDFIVLAQERSFTRAAELRHVTHPAFGRRIRALEAWAGTPLVERGGGPVTLTPAGLSFLETAGQLARNLAQSHEELQSLAGRQARTVTLATGRTLARTVVADWLVRLQPVLQGGELCIRTRALAETVVLLERGEADFSLLSEVDKIARAVGEKETKVDVLYMSAGFLPFEGRFDTAEGLEPSMTTRYYSRQLLLEKLLPLLSSQDAPSPRVVSVLAGGQEAPLDEADLDLRDKSSWSFWNASVHSATMHTLSLERVARENPRLSIVHWFPGPVSTPGLTRAANFGMKLPDPMSAVESGQRGVFHATSDRYARHGSLVPSVSGELLGVAKTTAGGIWLLDPRGEVTDNEKVLAEMRKDGLPDRVWEFTRGIFASAITTTTPATATTATTTTA